VLKCPYEMQAILQQAANGRVRCYDPQKGKQMEPDEFIAVDGGKHTVAVSSGEPPRYVSAMSDGSLRLGGIFEGPQTVGDQKIILYRQPKGERTCRNDDRRSRERKWVSQVSQRGAKSNRACRARS